ncbi:uncharacterized [Tachysurus ichikawai]
MQLHRRCRATRSSGARAEIPPRDGAPLPACGFNFTPYREKKKPKSGRLIAQTHALTFSTKLKVWPRTKKAKKTGATGTEREEAARNRNA